MTDHFAALGMPRRPWLDPEAVKREFLTRSAEVHPDRIHTGSESAKRTANQRFIELNAAHACLREPFSRLRHLLELESGPKPSPLEQVPESLASLFLAVAALCREVDDFLSRQALVTSPLLRARSFSEVQAWVDRLTSARHQLSGQQQELHANLSDLDRRWELTTDRKTLLPELERICRWLGFFSRWDGQLHERISRLMV